MEKREVGKDFIFSYSCLVVNGKVEGRKNEFK